MASKPIGGERDLWRLWEGCQLPAGLRTRDGRALHVLFPGLANNGAGPDFTGALLAFAGGAAQRGDVELHVRSSSWEGHGHHLDPRYAGVILHVTLLDDGGPARTSADMLVPVLALGPLLDAPPAPISPAAGPCLRLDAPRVPPEVARTAILLAGRTRFEARARRWESECATRAPEDCVLQALLRAIGLGRNAAACTALAAALDGVTFEALLDGAGAERRIVGTAVLLGMAGLLEQAHAGDDLRHAWLRYRDYWPGRPLEARQWQRFRLRPANLPEARLTLLGALLAEHGLRGFLDRIAAVVCADPVPTTAALLEPFAAAGSIAGRSWALETWANVLLPLLAGFGNAVGHLALADRAGEIYAALPGGGENQILERMVGIAGLATTPRSAMEQQGLLQLWADQCSRQQCETCPLAAG